MGKMKAFLVVEGEGPQPISLGGYKITFAARPARGGFPGAEAPANGAATTGPNTVIAAAPLGAGGVGLGSRTMPPDTRPFALVVNTAADEFLFIGSNGVPSFEVDSPGPARVAISSKDEGRYEAGKWVSGRRLNGDEFGSGLPNGLIGMLKIKLVRFE